MSKKLRVTFYICAAFLGSIVLFTTIFLIYFQHDATGAVRSAAGSAAMPSSYAVLGFGDLYTLSIGFAVLMLFIFFIAKS